MGSLSINNNAPTPSVTSGGYFPPHLRGFNNTRALSSAAPSVARSVSASNVAASTQGSGGYLPPHMRALKVPSVRGDDMQSASSVSNPYEGRSSAISSSSTIGGRPVVFSGWDNTGTQHRQVRLPSGTTTATPPTALAPAAVSVPADRSTTKSRGNENWARPVSTNFTFYTCLPNRSTPLRDWDIYGLS